VKRRAPEGSGAPRAGAVEKAAARNADLPDRPLNGFQHRSDSPRTSMIHVRVSRSERHVIYQTATKAGVTAAEWIRNKILAGLTP
jgi:hypothetical protein